MSEGLHIYDVSGNLQSATVVDDRDHAYFPGDETDFGRPRGQGDKDLGVEH